MGKFAIALAVAAVLASGSAAASDKTDAMAVVHKWVDSFNQGDSKSGNATCADETIIIDDFSPHVWQGSGACAKWFKDYEAFAAKAEMTQASVTLGKARHFDVESGYAYLVAAVTLAFSKSGKPITQPAVVTLTLKKAQAGWRITGWAWADQ